MKRALFLLFFLWVACSLAAQLPAVFQQEAYKQASVGIVLYDLDGQQEAYSSDAQQIMTPASLCKLLTAATALEMMGPEAVFETRLAYDGRIESGVLKGNVLLFPGGDPCLGSEYTDVEPRAFLKQWCRALKKRGVKRIEGQLLLDSLLFDTEAVSPYWLWEDLGNYYAAGVYDMAVFDNMYRLGLQSGKVGSRPKILYTKPSLPELIIDNHLSAADNQKDSAYLYGVPRRWERQLYGSIPAHRKQFEIKGDIPDPPAYLLSVFRQALQQEGIEILGKSIPKTQAQVLFRTTSLPMLSMLKIVLKQSNNMYTEYLLRHIAIACGYEKPVSAKDGLDAMRKFWKTKGLSSETWHLVDACGLSPLSRLSPEAIVEVLRYMDKSPYRDAFRQALPIAGKEGTLRSFGGTIPGELLLKSGSKTGVVAYAGYWNNAGKRYALAIIVNSAAFPNAQIRKDIECFLQSIEN